MKQNKLAVAVLILIAILFVLGLSAGIFRNKGEKDDELSMRKAEELKDRWIGSLDKIMAPFRKPFNFDRIENSPICQVSDGIYRLKGKKTCNIIIGKKEKKDANIQQAVLSVEENNVKIMVPYPDSEPCPETTRGPGISIGKFKDLKVATNILEKRPGLVRPNVSQQELKLSVIYIPSGKKDDEKARCEAQEEVTLMVLEDGGTLKLKCENCSNNQTVTVKLK